MNHELSLDCQPSRLHLLIILVSHGLALLALNLIEQQWAVTLMALVICFSAIYYGLRAFHYNRRSIVRLEALRSESQIEWKIELKNGEVKVVSLKSNAVVWTWLIACEFYDEEGSYSLVLLPDSLSSESHRHARVYFSLYGI